MRRARGEGLLECGAILRIEREGEEAQIVGPVLALAEPGADDHGGDRRLLAAPSASRRWRARRRARLAMAAAAPRMPCSTAQPPTASMKRLYFSLLQSPIVAGSGAPSQRSDRKPPHERAIGEQPDAVAEAEVAHVLGGPAVEQREAHLVGRDRHAAAQQHPQMIGVEIGDADGGDQPFSRSRASSRMASR